MRNCAAGLLRCSRQSAAETARSGPPPPRCIPTRSCRQGAAAIAAASAADRSRPPSAASASSAAAARRRRRSRRPRTARAKAPRRIACDRELVMARRARRQQVLERPGSAGAPSSAAERDDQRRSTAGRARRRRGDERREQQRGRAFGARLREQVDRRRAAPARDRAPVPARTGSRCSTSPGSTTTIAGQREQRQHGVAAEPAGEQPQRRRSAPCAVRKYAPHTIHDRQFGRDEDVVEALGPLEIDDEHAAVISR